MTTAPEGLFASLAHPASLELGRAEALTRMDVDTNNGTVYLTGPVAPAEQKAGAEQLAREAKGVGNVVDNRQVQRK